MATTVTKKSQTPSVLSGRIASIDFFRGLTMFLLIGESTGFFWSLK